ncbi:hypothetical protein GQ53DRAFT_551110 [Thozetella sp. PMI_491]|nr:hypothetical protein GQ53DRAFT_551110 [Thozetella sp. PMI_491]
MQDFFPSARPPLGGDVPSLGLSRLSEEELDTGCWSCPPRGLGLQMERACMATGEESREGGSSRPHGRPPWLLLSAQVRPRAEVHERMRSKPTGALCLFQRKVPRLAAACTIAVAGRQIKHQYERSPRCSGGGQRSSARKSAVPATSYGPTVASRCRAIFDRWSEPLVGPMSSLYPFSPAHHLDLSRSFAALQLSSIAMHVILQTLLSPYQNGPPLAPFLRCARDSFERAGNASSQRCPKGSWLAGTGIGRAARKSHRSAMVSLSRRSWAGPNHTDVWGLGALRMEPRTAMPCLYIAPESVVFPMAATLKMRYLHAPGARGDFIT